MSAQNDEQQQQPGMYLQTGKNVWRNYTSLVLDWGLEAPRDGSWGFRDAGPTPWSLGGSGNSSVCPPVLFVGYLFFGRAFLLGGLDFLGAFYTF